MDQQQHLPHKLTLDERRCLTMSGVTEVISFDDTAVTVQTGLGILLIQGQQLRLRQLTVEGGNVCVEGRISGLSYEEPRSSGGWFSRLIR